MRYDKTVIDKNANKWFTENRIPTLGEARGKIVLMRRYWAPTDSATAIGFDASSGWADNTTFTLKSGNYKLACQDHYQLDNHQDKWKSLSNFFDEMQSAQADTYYLNNTSGYIPGIFDIPNLNKICKPINQQLLAYLKNTKDIKGIIACDHITREIAKEIVGLNFK